MTKIDVCKDGKWEWRNGELFIVSISVLPGSAWVGSKLAQEVRNSIPDPSAEFPIFIIERTSEGDSAHKVIDSVVFAGGDILFLIV